MLIDVNRPCHKQMYRKIGTDGLQDFRIEADFPFQVTLFEIQLHFKQKGTTTDRTFS